MMKRTIGSSYSSKTDTVKFVKFMPEEWKSDKAVGTIKYLNKLKRSTLFLKCQQFQNESVSKWNPYYNQISKFIVLKVFLHDEITTDGYGKCVVELLTKHGILVKNVLSDNVYE